MDRSAYSQHYELDKRHFWRIAKRRLVLQWIERFVPQQGDLRLLDIGGACSIVSQQLERFGEVTVVEPDHETADLARSQLGLSVRIGALPNDIDLPGSFDVVTLLDVLEHIDDDLASLQTIHGLLNPSGILLLTVPAYQWLWSDHDVVLHHRRRYTRSRLRSVLQQAGFAIERMSYYTSLLLPVVATQRLASRLQRSTGEPRYRVRQPHRLVNSLMGAVMSLERLLLNPLNMPFGSSLIAVARRGPSGKRSTLERRQR